MRRKTPLRWKPQSCVCDYRRHTLCDVDRKCSFGSQLSEFKSGAQLSVGNLAQTSHEAATICLGEPERVSSSNLMAFNVKFPHEPNKPTINGVLLNPPKLESIMVGANVVIELLGKQKQWPCLVTPGGNMRLGQKRNLSIGEEGQGRLKFTLSADEPPNNDQPPTFRVSLKYEGDDLTAIKPIEEQLRAKREEMQRLEAKKDDKRSRDLNTEIRPLQGKIDQFYKKLEDMRIALTDSPLQYRIVLRFEGGKERVLYTTETKPGETRGKPVNGHKPDNDARNRS